MADQSTFITINKAPETTTLPEPAGPGQPSFVQRLIEVGVKLSQSQAPSGQPRTFVEGGDTVTLSGSRTSVRIENSGGAGGSHASVSVFGLTPSLMNQLSALGIAFNQVQRNTITVQAGDAVSGLTPVFAGTISFAYGDYNQQPNVPFHFECQAGTADATAPAVASSFTGPTDVATIMSGFARQLQVGFENSGVTTQLSNPYFAGNIFTQMQKAAEHAHINAQVINNKLCIWPIGSTRTPTGSVPLISPATGMIGYPSYGGNGYLIVRMIFNPAVSFGSQIKVQSSLKIASKTWVVQQLDLALDSMVPKGKWEATAQCYQLGLAAPAPQKAGP